MNQDRCSYNITASGEYYCSYHEHSGRYVPNLKDQKGLLSLFDAIMEGTSALPRVESVEERVSIARALGAL